MTISRPYVYVSAGTVFLLLTWLFVGLFRDDEFYEPSLFLKYRPTMKVNFYSPIHMSDLTLNDLSPGDRKEAIAFQEFVMDQNKQTQSTLWDELLPLMLIQGMLTFFCFGIIKFRRNFIAQWWSLPIHFVAGISLTLLGLVFILHFDKLLYTIKGLTAIIALNYWIASSLLRVRKSD